MMLDPIELAEKEIKRDKEDLKRLKKRYPGYDFVRTDYVMDSVAKSASKANPPELTGFDLGVLAHLDSYPKSEWTSRLTLNALRETDFRLPDKEETAMNAIALSLMALRDNGRIVQTYIGKGRDPHRFMSLLSGEETEVEKEATSKEITS